MDEIETVAVLGAGTMGHGIAEVAALAGFDVRLRDVEEKLAREGRESAGRRLDALVEHGEVEREDADAALDRIEPVVDLDDALEDADFVVEAVGERLDLKREVFRDAETHAPADAVLATNTSSLSVTEIAAATDSPERCCGMHFFNPPDRMELVEVVPGEQTGRETVETTVAFAETLGRTPVELAHESPGFVVNRVLLPALNEAAWLVHEDEVTVAAVDAAARHGLDLPMGAFELLDWIGIDVCVDVLEYVADRLGPAYEPCPLLAERVEAGELGRKTGAGFYDYDDGGAEIPEDAGADRRDELVRGLLAPMANETAKLVDDGIADADTVDTAMVLGANFPAGPARLADDAGLATLADYLRERHRETGAPRYEPAPGLERRAEEGTGFHERLAGEAGADTTAGDGGPGGESENGDESGGSGDDPGADANDQFETVAVEREGAVGRLTIDRPERHNTIDETVLAELVDAVEAFEEDDAVRAILLTGAGDRAFSAGADVTGLAGDATPRDAVSFSRVGQRAFGRVESSPLPVVAAIDGFCLGGGMELAACADLRVASERARLGQPETNLGLIPGWGGTQRLARIVGEGRAREIVLTGDRYDAATMADYGFVNEVVDPEDLDAHALDLVEELAAGPSLAFDAFERALLAGRDDLDAGLEVEAQAFGHLLATRDAEEGLAAFEEDRAPEFEGR